MGGKVKNRKINLKKIRKKINKINAKIILFLENWCHLGCLTPPLISYRHSHKSLYLFFDDPVVKLLLHVSVKAQIVLRDAKSSLPTLLLLVRGLIFDPKTDICALDSKVFGGRPNAVSKNLLIGNKYAYMHIHYFYRVLWIVFVLYYMAGKKYTMVY